MPDVYSTLNPIKTVQKVLDSIAMSFANFATVTTSVDGRSLDVEIFQT